MFGILQELKVYTLIRSSYVVPVDADAATLHWHDYYQFIYVRKGPVAVITEQETIVLSEKEALIVPCNAPHSLASCGERNETYEVKFSLCGRGAELLGTIPCRVCRDVFGEINLSLRQMERESNKLDRLSREIVAVEMYKILLLMQREPERTGETDTAAELTDMTDDKLLHTVDQFIEENMSRNITVKDVANHMCIEYKYFSHYFASRYEIRLKQYITDKQIAKARELLVSTTLSITAVAEQCGFGDSRHLAKMFKASEKLSPTEFRKRHQTIRAVTLEPEPASFYDLPEAEATAKKQNALLQQRQMKT